MLKEKGVYYKVLGLLGDPTPIFSTGSIVILDRDDDTEAPLFRLVEGYCMYDNCKNECGLYGDDGAYYPWSDLEETNYKG